MTHVDIHEWVDKEFVDSSFNEWMPTQLNLNGSNTGASAPSSAFFGSSLKKMTQKLPKACSPSGGLGVRAMADDEEKQTNKDKWRGLAYDTSDDQQDITRGRAWSTPSSKLPWALAPTTLS